MMPEHMPHARRERVWLWTQYILPWCAFLFIFFIPLSGALMRICSSLGIAALLAHYALRPKAALIRDFSWRWLFFAMLLWFFINCFFSINIPHSFMTMKHIIYSGMLLFLLGLEATGKITYVRLFPWVLCLCAFIQGLDGIWQYITGFDAIRGYPLMSGRLTASFASYRVGDLVALLLSVGLALPYAMPQSWPCRRRLLITAVLWAPALFLLVFAWSRSSWMCIAVASACFYSFHKGISWRWVLPLLVAFVLLLLFGFERIRLDYILHDGRIIELWPIAWKVFLANPLVGCGLGTFMDGYQALGISLVYHGGSMTHPHNIFLQLLAETGIIGFILFTLFLSLTMFWAWKILRRAKHLPEKYIWAIGAACWSAGIGYIVMGMFAHALFKPWWMGLPFVILGIMAGICRYLKQRLDEERNTVSGGRGA